MLQEDASWLGWNNQIRDKRMNRAMIMIIMDARAMKLANMNHIVHLPPTHTAWDDIDSRIMMHCIDEIDINRY